MTTSASTPQDSLPTVSNPQYSLHAGSNSEDSLPDASTSSSSSTLPHISKKRQVKLDKKSALRDFKMGKKSDKKKKCSSCGLDNHERKSSSLCLNYKQKEAKSEPEEKEETFVIKCSLKNVCKDREFIDAITSVTTYTTKVMFIGSLFINYYFLKVLSNDEDVPVIDHTFIYSVFTLITGNGKKTPTYIKDVFNEFCTECEINQATLKSLTSIGYSSVLSIVCKQYETLVRNHICENHEKRTTRFFLEALSNKSSPFFCKDMSIAKRKSLAHYIYTLKMKQESVWPSSVEKSPHLEDIVKKLNLLWSNYQDLNNDPEDLYSQPHRFFKWMFYLQKEVNKKVYIMEETPLKVASKSYVYRKLKDLSFTKTLNRRSFKSLQEQVLESINTNTTLVLGKKLKKLEPHLSAILKFVEIVQSRIKDNTFTPTKYTDQRGYRYFTLLPIYTFAMKSVQIDAQAFWRLAKQCNIEGYKKGPKTESDLYDFYYKLFDFSKIGFRKLEKLSKGRKKFRYDYLFSFINV